MLRRPKVLSITLVLSYQRLSLSGMLLFAHSKSTETCDIYPTAQSDDQRCGPVTGEVVCQLDLGVLAIASICYRHASKNKFNGSQKHNIEARRLQEMVINSRICLMLANKDGSQDLAWFFLATYAVLGFGIFVVLLLSVWTFSGTV